MVHPVQSKLESMDDSGDKYQTESEPDEPDDNNLSMGNSDDDKPQRKKGKKVRVDPQWLSIAYKTAYCLHNRTKRLMQLNFNRKSLI